MPRARTVSSAQGVVAGAPRRWLGLEGLVLLAGALIAFGARGQPWWLVAALKVWSKRYRDLGRARTQVACRLHQVLCELVPGGVPGEITARQAGQVPGIGHASGRGGRGPLGARRRADAGSARR
jgi:hypothetical protein